MKIFLSHSSRDKALVREVKELLPRFLDDWLDEDKLCWGDSFPKQLKETIQSGIDFLLIFLDTHALNSNWVMQELDWAIQRERELNRTFVLPILLEDANLPDRLKDRLSLKLIDQNRSSVEDLAKRITENLFHLVAKSYSSLQLEVPSRKSLISLRDELTAGQARLLGYLIERGKDGSEIAQRQIEQEMGYSHPSNELYYRLESLIQQGFVHKRRIATEGQFSYALTEEFRSQMSKP